MAMRIMADGAMDYHSPANGVDYQLDELQRLVGGPVEVVPLRWAGKSQLLMVCHEEGKLLGLEPNVKATLIWEAYYGPTDVIVGPVLLCYPDEIK